MTFLEELNHIVDACGLPVETGVFSGKAPDAYVVITPLTDMFSLFADNRPQAGVNEASLSIFTKKNYKEHKTAILRALVDADFTITDCRYIDYEISTKYYHYYISVAKTHEWSEENGDNRA